MNLSQNKRTLSLFTYMMIGGALFSGMLIGYFISRNQSQQALPPVRTVHLLSTDGHTTRNWNNITIEEGKSVADILDKVASIEQVFIAWDGQGKERILNAFLNDQAGLQWTYYINNAQPGQPIGRFIPKHGDVIVLTAIQKS